MGNFKIFNVKGDGNCYYRSIWHIVREHPDLAEALYVEHICDEDEDEGAEEVRTYVSLSLKHEKPTQDMLKALMALYKDVPSIIDCYPLLKFTDPYGLDDFDGAKDNVCLQIDTSKMMASSFEHEVIMQRMSTMAPDCHVDVQLIVLTQLDTEKTEDMVDRWFTQLKVLVSKTTCDRVAILINQDNIHYKYTRFLGKSVINRLELENYLNESDDDN